MSEVDAKRKVNKQPNKQPMPSQDPKVRIKELFRGCSGYTEEDAVIEAEVLKL